MKILLRSTFISQPSDDRGLFFRNFLDLNQSRLEFDSKEAQQLWAFIHEFSSKNNHVPEFRTVRNHFEHRVRQLEVVDYLDTIAALPSLVRGDFRKRLEDKVHDLRVKKMSSLLKDTDAITMTGLQIKGERGKKEILEGPIAAVRYFVDKSHDIVTPAFGSRLSGEITSDGDDLLQEYEEVKADPRTGLGQMTGIHQMDSVLKGAKKGTLWIHAAFTGHLKCVTGDTRVYDLASRRLVSVKDLFEQGCLPRIPSLDESSGKMVDSPVSHLQESGVRHIWKVTTKSGFEVRVSGNHPLLTPTGWVKAEELSSSDWVALPSRLPTPSGASPYSDAEIALVGYLLGDGTFVQQLGFCSGNPKIIADVESHLASLGYTEKEGNAYSTKPTYRKVEREGSVAVCISRSKGDKYHPWVSPLRSLLESFGLWGKGSGEKFVPGSLWGMTDDQLWLFLSSLWSTDGSVKVIDRKRTGRRDTRQVNLYYSSKSKRLASDIQLLLQRVGVRSTLSPVRVSYKGEQRIYWNVQITTQDSKRLFLKHTNLVGKEEDAASALGALGDLTGQDRFPPSVVNLLPDTLRYRTKRGGWYYAKWAKQKKTLCRNTVALFGEAACNNGLTKLANSDVWWDTIASIEKDGLEMTYDLSVPATQNFVANGIITHNSLFALNWVYNQAIWYQENVLFFSLEMPYQQVRRMLFAIHSSHPKFNEIRIKHGLQRDLGTSAGISYERLRDGELTDVEEWFLKEQVIPDYSDPTNGYGKLFIEVSDPEKTDFTIVDLRSKAELLHSKTPISFVIVDHVLLMSSRNKYNSTTERLNEVVRDLKKFSMGFNRGEAIAVVGLFQLSREGYKRVEKLREKDKEPLYSLFDLSYSNECLKEGTLIPTARGLLPIEDVIVGDTVWSRSGPKDVLSVFDQGTQPVWEILTDHGTQIDVTGGHRVRVAVGCESVEWREVSDLSDGDRLLVPSRSGLPFPGTPVADEYRKRFNSPSVGVMRVVSVRQTGEEAQMYDLEVPGDHEYLTGPLYSHNCERSGDVITATYVNLELEAQNQVMFQCLKSRDSKKFESFFARVCYEWRRVLPIKDEIDELESGAAEDDFIDTTLEE